MTKDYENLDENNILPAVLVVFLNIVAEGLCFLLNAKFFSIVELAVIAIVIILSFIYYKKSNDKYNKMLYYALLTLLGNVSCVTGPGYGVHILLIAMIVPVALCRYKKMDKINFKFLFLKLNFKTIEKICVVVYVTLIYLIMHVMYRWGIAYIVSEDDKTAIIAVAIFSINFILTILLTLSSIELFISYINRNEELLAQKADYDELTELYNRNRIRFILEHNYSVAMQDNVDFGVAIMDIDDFKKINDTYGHNTGDYVLRKFAHIVDLIVKKCDGQIVAGRWGGEEFMIIYYGDNKEDFYMLLEYIRVKIYDAIFLYEKNEMNVTITIGMAMFDRELTVDEIINKADMNLYDGKKSGKNKVVWNS